MAKIWGMLVMIRLGIVGTDHVAMRMINCAAQLQDVRITAICSTPQGPANALAQPLGAAICDNASELSSRSDVDAVYVTSKNADHAADARAAIGAGKPVLVQKPIAMTPEESASVVAAARDANVLLLENMWCLTVPAAQAMIHRADARALGQPRLFSLDFGYPVTPDLYPALFSPDLGVLRDRGGYGIAFATRLLGPVVEISSQVTWQNGVDTSATVSLRHVSGGLSHLSFSFDAILSNKATLSCTGGLYQVEPSLGSENLISQVAAAQIGPLTKPQRLRLRSITMGQALKRLRKAPRPEKLGYGSDLHLPMLRHFLELVKTGQKDSPLVPMDLSVTTQTLVERIRAQIGQAA
jgi:predicted dehydrogenase